MKSIKNLKKNLNNIVNEAVEEAYSYMLYNPGKNEKKAKEIIDEAADKKDQILTSINGSKNIKDKKEISKQFTTIKKEVSDLKMNMEKALEKLIKSK